MYKLFSVTDTLPDGTQHQHQYFVFDSEREYFNMLETCRRDYRNGIEVGEIRHEPSCKRSGIENEFQGRYLVARGFTLHEQTQDGRLSRHYIRPGSIEHNREIAMQAESLPYLVTYLKKVGF